jgi:hypothetical protein
MSKLWQSRNHPLATVCWVGGYVLTISAIFYGLTKVREKQHVVTNTKLEDSWMQWREAAAEQASGAGPVQRKIPKSALPPLQVLFTEHFKTITTAALVFGTFLYGMLYFFTRGIFARDRIKFPHAGHHATPSKREHSPD